MASFLSVDLYNFRSWRTLSYEPKSGISFIAGANGSGKTNILEACFYAVMAKSFRHARLKEMIMGGEKEFSIRIKAESHGRTHDLKVSGSVADHSFSLDGHRIGSVADLVGRFPVMVFSPDDLSIVTGAPMERRRFINMLLSQCSTSYFRALLSYNRTLHQRNAALKQFPVNNDLVAVLRDSLIETGSALRYERKSFIKELSCIAHTILQSIGGEEGEFLYWPDCDNSVDEKARLLEEAKNCAVQEEFEKTTLFGPHTDDIKIKICDKEAKRFGSRGQVRSIVLSAKIAGIELLERYSGERCILLMDDIFSELDDGRARELFFTLPNERQVLIALPSIPNWIERNGCNVFNIGV